MKVRITTTDGMLGTSPADEDLYRNFIATKCTDSEKVEAEIASLETDERVEKSMTVFHRKDGKPILYDYEIRGFLKEWLGIFCEFEEFKIGKTRITKWTHKRFVDNYIFVTPREITLDMPGGTAVTTCTRPLRATTLRGDRIALAHSEEVPEGTTFEFEVQCDHPALEEIIRRALDGGCKKGIGQWRNSGKGRFNWEEI